MRDFQKEPSELGWTTGEKENDTVKLKVADSLTKQMW